MIPFRILHFMKNEGEKTKTTSAAAAAVAAAVIQILHRVRYVTQAVRREGEEEGDQARSNKCE